MSLENFLTRLEQEPDKIQFQETMDLIEELYEFHETRFVNGNTINEAGQNNGSCKLFAFAKLNQLSQEQTLACFGDYYRVDVLQHPDADDHQNIRNFIEFGWDGIQFNGSALLLK